MMKILILLALVGVILVNIPPPAAGLKCVICAQEGPLKCRDYKKGDTSFEQTCPDVEKAMKGLPVPGTDDNFGNFKLGKPVCMSAKAGSACSFESIGQPGSCKEDVCFCDEDLCNKAANVLGGSSAGILVISLGILVRQLFH